MTIYISGNIVDLHNQEQYKRFEESEKFLKEIGFNAINPLKHFISAEFLSEHFSDNYEAWEKVLCCGLPLLLHCDAIYMFDDWVCSLGSAIEYDVATRMGKVIYFESFVMKTHLITIKVQNAIHEVMGLKFYEYVAMSKVRELFYARMIFVHHCRKSGMTLMQIARYINREHSTVWSMEKKYNDDYKYNPQFRELAEQVNEIMNKTVKEHA